MKDSGKVLIHGKEYETVASRIHKFRESHGNHSLVTDVLERTNDCVVVKAAIFNDNDRLVATGHAEEYRSASNINKTSALENAETSAIGRALASFGLGGTEFASADELTNAITTKPSASKPNRTVRNSPKKEETINPRNMVKQLSEKLGMDVEVVDDDGLPVDSEKSWKDAVIHFGKNKDTRLEDLSPRQVSWYANEWQPKPYKGAISGKDQELRDALDQYLKECDGPVANSKVDDTANSERVVAMDKLNKIIADIGVDLPTLKRHVSEGYGKTSLSDLTPVEIDSLADSLSNPIV